MAENSIQEWLADYKNLSPVEVHSFATSLANSHELIYAIFSVLEDRTKHDLLEQICNQLFGFYRSQETELQHFVIQYVPTLIGVYLTSLGQPEFKTRKTIELLILGIYNLNVVNAHGKPHTHSFQLPSLAQPSIYHESLSTITTADNLLRGMDKTEPHLITLGPFPQVETLNGQNRLRVMTILMNTYNANLSFISKPSLRFMCKMCSKLVKQGFARQGHFQRSSYGSDNLFTNLAYQRTNQRLTLSAPFLLEILHAVYFAMYNGHYQVAVQALEDIHTRATYELFVEVILVTNAIRSSLKLNPSGQALEGPMGINVALSPSTAAPSLSKAIITNASFRTKKLPDDIPIQDGEKLMTTISEEQEETTNDKDKMQKTGKVKEKISMGNLIAKAKGLRKDDATPSVSRSVEKTESRKKFAITDSMTTIKGLPVKSNGEINDGTTKTPDITKNHDSGKSKSEARHAVVGKSDEELSRDGRKLSDGFLVETTKIKREPSYGVVGQSSGHKGVNRGTEVNHSHDKNGVAPAKSTSRTTNSRQMPSGKGTESLRGGECSPTFDALGPRRFDVSRSADTVYLDKRDEGGGLGASVLSTFSDTTSKTTEGSLMNRKNEEPSVAILRLIDGRIADITRSSDSGRLGNGRNSVSLSNSKTMDEDELDDDESLSSEFTDSRRRSDEESLGRRSSDSFRMGDIPRLGSETRKLEKRKSDEAMLATSRISDEQKIGIRFKESNVNNGPEAHCYLPAGGNANDTILVRDNLSTRDDGQRVDLLRSVKGSSIQSMDKHKADANLSDSLPRKTGDLSHLDVLPRRNIGRGYNDEMEMKLLQHGNKVELSDSSEETEQSYSLDVSYSCSTFTDSEEDLPHSSRNLEQKVQRESVHTFV